MKNNSNLTYEEDEIDLRELLITLLEKKTFIALTTSLITLLAIFYAYFKVPIYEVKSNVQLGFIDDKLIVEPATLVKTLNIVFNIENKIASKEKFISQVSSITTNKKIKNFIEIKAEGISNNEALNLNKKVVQYIQKKYKNKITQYIREVHNSIYELKSNITRLDQLQTKNIKQKIQSLKKQSLELEEKIDFYNSIQIPSLKKKITYHEKTLEKYIKAVKNIYLDNQQTMDSTILTISSIQMINYQNLILSSQNAIEDLSTEIKFTQRENISTLQKEIDNIDKNKIRKLQFELTNTIPEQNISLQQKIDQLKDSISSTNIRNSTLVGDYIIHDYPIKPKKKLIVIVAFITGFILSIFLVFFLQFMQNFKEENNP